MRRARQNRALRKFPALQPSCSCTFHSSNALLCSSGPGPGAATGADVGRETWVGRRSLLAPECAEPWDRRAESRPSRKSSRTSKLALPTCSPMEPPDRWWAGASPCCALMPIMRHAVSASSCAKFMVTHLTVLAAAPPYSSFLRAAHHMLILAACPHADTVHMLPSGSPFPWVSGRPEGAAAR